MSYILLSLSNIGSPLYVWVFSDYAISEASEEVSANYAEILSTLTSPWFMVLAIAATVVISIIVGVIAKKVYNKQFANAGIMWVGDRMKIHASGEDYLEAVLMLQKEKGMVRSVDWTDTWAFQNRVSVMQ